MERHRRDDLNPYAPIAPRSKDLEAAQHARLDTDVETGPRYQGGSGCKCNTVGDIRGDGAGRADRMWRLWHRLRTLGHDHRPRMQPNFKRFFRLGDFENADSTTWIRW